ncbi:hypothetical protein BDK51DRAFT_42318 [Blyttiomyces helicus]|uniref:Uncharacterized protein n=1 Tax=Blyttiomyces helicus TaxID=388810 RepID=A0A4P9WND4_9FUNG|nr:hypothetical protein BDK51DRAFT_42318 [Blyttiomyces helicus]|eukprot:RKO93198.1 hypothetical protein BDK51DRAFT_42318 [Blyttiomyces helicus]
MKQRLVPSINGTRHRQLSAPAPASAPTIAPPLQNPRPAPAAAARQVLAPVGHASEASHPQPHVAVPALREALLQGSSLALRLPVPEQTSGEDRATADAPPVDITTTNVSIIAIELEEEQQPERRGGPVDEQVAGRGRPVHESGATSGLPSEQNKRSAPLQDAHLQLGAGPGPQVCAAALKDANDVLRNTVKTQEAAYADLQSEKEALEVQCAGLRAEMAEARVVTSNELTSQRAAASRVTDNLMREEAAQAELTDARLQLDAAEMLRIQEKDVYVAMLGKNEAEVTAGGENIAQMANELAEFKGLEVEGLAELERRAAEVKNLTETVELWRGVVRILTGEMGTRAESERCARLEFETEIAALQDALAERDALHTAAQASAVIASAAMISSPAIVASSAQIASPPVVAPAGHIAGSDIACGAAAAHGLDLTPGTVIDRAPVYRVPSTPAAYRIPRASLPTSTRPKSRTSVARGVDLPPTPFSPAPHSPRSLDPASAANSSSVAADIDAAKLTQSEMNIATASDLARDPALAHGVDLTPGAVLARAPVVPLGLDLAFASGSSTAAAAIRSANVPQPAVPVAAAAAENEVVNVDQPIPQVVVTAPVGAPPVVVADVKPATRVHPGRVLNKPMDTYAERYIEAPKRKTEEAAEKKRAKRRRKRWASGEVFLVHVVGGRDRDWGSVF